MRIRKGYNNLNPHATIGKFSGTFPPLWEKLLSLYSNGKAGVIPGKMANVPSIS